MNAPNPPIVLNESEVEFVAIRAQGAGGQNVNKVSNAIHLRFDIGASSLPEGTKIRLLQLRDQRISGDGIVVIKAQAHRSLERSEPLQPPFHVKGRPASEEALLPLPDLLYPLNRSIFQNYDAL